MALPNTGGTYAATLQPTINPLAVRKMIVTDILIRDYFNDDGTVRSLADADVGLNADGVFSPFALDGKLRTDLLITSDDDPNLGFYHLASLHEDGIEMSYDTSVSDTMIAQSKRAVRFDVTSDNDGITIKAMEGIPLVDALRYDLRLSSLADIGEQGYYITKPAETPLVERQVIALGFDQDYYTAQVFPRMSLKNRGNTSWNKADADLMELELGALLCPYVGTPAIFLREGANWRGLQGYPTFAAAPVATATAGQEAEIVFDVPTSKSSSFTYVVEKSNDGSTGWTTATTDTTAGTTEITITVTGITTSLTWYFRVKATGTNGLTTTSSNSNSVVGLS